MSSSKLSKATAPSVIPTGTITPASSGSSSNYSFSPQGSVHAGAGIVHTVNIGSSYTISADGVIDITAAKLPQTVIETVATEDNITTAFYEQIAGQLVKAELQPEHDLNASELLRISVLISHLNGKDTYSAQVKPVTYIRRHNLERHFRFSAK